MKVLKIILLLFVLSFSIFSCKKEDDPIVETKKRTVAIYMVAENDLMRFGIQNIRQILMSAPKLKDGEEIVLYLDINKFPAIYTINNKTKGEKIFDLTPEYEYTTDQNSCSGVALSEFLGYVKSKHKADSYGIVLWSHGTGWIPSSYSSDSGKFARRRSFGVDTGNNNTESSRGNSMSISELHSALKSMGQKFDYILFDCCFMQCVEVDYELRDVAKYIIASPAEIPGPGAPYHLLLPEFFAEKGYENSLPKIYYDLYYDYNAGYGVIISSCDCSMMDDFARATEKVVSKYKSTLLNASYADVLDYFNYDLYRNKGYKMPDFYDINGIMKSYIAKDDYEEWRSAFLKAYPYSYTTETWYSAYPAASRLMDLDQFGGASMYVPLDKYTKSYFMIDNNFFVEGFKDSEWAKVVWE